MDDNLPVIEADDRALAAMQEAEKELEESYERELDESRISYTLVRDST